MDLLREISKGLLVLCVQKKATRTDCGKEAQVVVGKKPKLLREGNPVYLRERSPYYSIIIDKKRIWIYKDQKVYLEGMTVYGVVMNVERKKQA